MTVAALATVTMWASAFVGIRAVAGTFSPGSIALGRLLAGVIVLAAVALLRPRPVISRGDLVAVLAAGVLWFGVYSVGLSAGEREVDAGTANLLTSVAPILITVLAGAFLREGFPRQLVAGCVLALLGTALVATSASDGESRGPTGQGVLLVLGATVAYATAATLQRRALRNVPGAWVNLLGVLAAIAVCLPFAPGLAAELRGTNPSQWAWLVYLGVFPTALGFTTWAYVLKRTAAGRTAAVTYLIPPITIALSWLFLAELPTTLALVGGAICVAGVALTRSPSLLRLPVRARSAGRLS